MFYQLNLVKYNMPYEITVYFNKLK